MTQKETGDKMEESEQNSEPLVNVKIIYEDWENLKKEIATEKGMTIGERIHELIILGREMEKIKKEENPK